MDTLEFFLRLGLALLLGAAIGIERQWRQKSAGLRTNTLVSLGSAAFILLSVSMTGTTGDPSRVAGQIVTGIGFLGAGVIMRDGLTVQGLNTAATIWCSAAVGALAGVGLWRESMIVAGAIIFTHVLFRPMDVFLAKVPLLRSRMAPTDYLFTVECRPIGESHVRVLLMQHLSNDDKLLLRSIASNDRGDYPYSVITAEITATGQQDNLMERMAGKLTVLAEVIKVKWEMIGQKADL